jgi:outer membrane protein
MGFVCRHLLWLPLMALSATPLPAQITPHMEKAFQFEARARRSLETQQPTGFLDHVVDGKLTLSLDDAVRLALMNNTDIRIDEEQVETARNALERALGFFDPTLQGSFNSTRQATPEYTQLEGGPPTLNQLNQNTQVGMAQNLETGANIQASFTSSKSTSNSTFFFFSPAFFTYLSFTFTQPLLKGAGLFVNRAPIVIGQRGVSQARATFEAEVNDLLLQVVGDYWSVIQARESLVVQQESLDAARKSYDHDKHALELGALPPLDIYRSQSQVASRRLSVIQAEYALKRQENQLRRDLAADVDPNIRALDLDLTEKPDPNEPLMAIEIPAALDKALNYRPELESLRQQLASDEINLRVAHNGLEPSLSLQGGYTTSGLNSILSSGNFEAGSYGSAISQMFGFGFPTYAMGVTLSYPFRNRQAQAELGDALSSKRRDLYSERRLREQITLEVTNAVHQLEESKLSMEAAKVALDYAQRTVEAEQHKYELGAETVFFVLEAQTERTQAQQNLLQAEVGYQNATAQVEHDTGGLLAKFQVEITNLSP